MKLKTDAIHGHGFMSYSGVLAIEAILGLY